MTKAKKNKLKLEGNYPYSLSFETRFFKYKLIITDNEILEIYQEDHRNYAGGISYEKDGFKNSPLIEQLEDMIKDEISSKDAEKKIKFFLQKEIDKIVPLYDKNILNMKTNLKVFGD